MQKHTIKYLKKFSFKNIGTNNVVETPTTTASPLGTYLK